MALTVLYFAKARSVIGCSREVFELTSTVLELLNNIVKVHPSLCPIVPSCAVAVNEVYIVDYSTCRLHDGDVVALIPPVSGG